MITKDTDSDDLNYTKEQLLDVISVVEDPDIGISIVDMGLIYDVEFKKEEKKVDVEMTLTSPACPYGQQLISEVEYVLKTCKGVEDVDLDAREQGEPVIAEALNDRDLFAQPLRRQTVRHAQPRRMVGQREIFALELARRLHHRRDRRRAVRPVRMAVQVAAQQRAER